MTALPAPPLPRPSTRPGIILGLGLGGFVDGITLHQIAHWHNKGLIDHEILNLHHVRDLPAHVPAYDWLFLAIGGVGFIALGWLLSRRATGVGTPRA